MPDDLAERGGGEMGEGSGGMLPFPEGKFLAGHDVTGIGS